MAATKSTAKKASGGSKPAFGGYTVSFAGRDDSVEKVFGSKPIPPSQMTKALWAYVKKNNLSSK